MRLFETGDFVEAKESSVHFGRLHFSGDIIKAALSTVSLLSQSALIAALTASTLKTTYLTLSASPLSRAVITTALLLSLLATILAVILQQILAALSSLESMRMWLSNGDAPTHPPSKPQQSHSTHKQTSDPNPTLKISVASLLLLRLPNTLLLSSSALYALGLGSHLLLTWILPHPQSPTPSSAHMPTLLLTLIAAPSLLLTIALLRRKMREIQRAERLGRQVASARARATGGRGGGGGDIEAPPTRSVDEVNEIEAAMLREKSGAGGGSVGGGGNGSGKEAPKRERERELQQPAFTHDEVRYHEDVAGALEEAAKAHRDLAELIREAMMEEQ